jgi:hypothetical protein
MEDEEASWSEFVIGHNDARERYVALSYDYRGVANAFDMTIEGGEGSSGVRIPTSTSSGSRLSRPTASWRARRPPRTRGHLAKDFDLILERPASR